MNAFKNYRKKNLQPMRPYIPGEDLTGVSVSPEDTPEEGGMIAINEDNPADQWYVAKAFFETNYEEVAPMPKKMRAKVKLSSVQRFEHSEQLIFNAVSKSTAYPEDGSDEDNTYAKFTPQAEFKITVTNPDLVGGSEPGEKYYVDFSPAD